MANKETLTQLVKSARSGNTQSINKLFEACYNDIYYFALKTVKNEDTAYDITQETCIEIFNGLSTLENESAFTTWSRQIAYRRCCRYFEKNRDVLVDEGDEENNIFDSVEDSDEDFIPDEALDRDDFRKTIMDMINNLSEEQRTAVMLYYFDELSVNEIAQIQGVSEGTVKSRLNYARKSIKSAVEDYEEKNNIKLHSFGLLPLLLWLRGGDMAGISIPSAGAGLQSAISALTSAGASATAAAVNTVASTAAKTAPPPFVGSTPPMVATTATTVASTATKSIATKIIAAVAAVAIAIGGGTVAYKVISNKNDDKIQQEDSTQNPISADGTSIIDLNKDYSSDYLVPYCTKKDFNRDFNRCVGVTARLFITNDGQIYDFDEPDTPIGQALTPADVHYLHGSRDLVYTNTDGSTVIYETEYTQNYGEINNPTTEIRDLNYTFVGSGSFTRYMGIGESLDYIQILTRDDAGSLYISEYENQTGNYMSGPTPLKLFSSGNELTDIKEVHHFSDTTYLILAGNTLYQQVYDISYDDANGYYSANVYPIAENIDDVYYFDEFNEMPIYTKIADNKNLYTLHYSGGLSSTSYDESFFSLPDEYTVDEIETLIYVNNFFLITFSDGCVYTYDKHDEIYEELTYLTNYNKQGAILNFHIPFVGSRKPDEIILHMDNNNLYSYSLE